MSETDRTAGYCGRCGNPVYEDDSFCGACGAAVLAPPPRAEQVLPQPAAAAQGATVGRGRRLLFLAGILGTLLALLVGGGVLALAGFGSGGRSSGGSESRPPSPDARGAETPSRAEATPGPGATEASNPAPTTVDLMQGFVSDHFGALSDGDYADAYSMLDEESRQKITEEEWEDARAGLGASSDPSRIASATVEGPYVSETQSPFTTNVRISYEDGASETVELGLVSEYVVDEAGDFRRHLTDGDVSSIEGSASTENTASVPPSSPEPTTFGLSPEGEDQVREAAEQYYYAVDYESWGTTYYNLDVESKALFTEEEWIAKNRWYAETEGLELDSMEIDVSMDGEERAEVTVDRTFTDGTSITRDTVFVWEGYWRHHLTEEEKEIFMPGVPYEEFVAAQ